MKRGRGKTRYVPNVPHIGIVAAVPIAIMGLIVPIVLIVNRGGGFIPPLAIVLAIGSILLFIIAFVIRQQRLVRRVAESDGFLCLNCQYDLHGLEDSGECPECGEDYQREDLERRWNLWLLGNTKNTKTLRSRLERDAAAAGKPALTKPRGPRFIFLSLLPLVLIAPVMILSFVAYKSGTVPVWLPASVIPLLVTVAAWNARRVTRFQQRVRGHDYLLCLRCRSDLRNEPSDEGRCRQCGALYRKDEVREAWRKFLTVGMFSGA